MSDSGERLRAVLCVVPSRRLIVGTSFNGPRAFLLVGKGKMLAISSIASLRGGLAFVFGLPLSTGLNGWCSTTVSRAAQGAQPAPSPAGSPQYQESRFSLVW